ncbi:hypothetical protein C8J57DRAFT_1233000 [Mycena rebaudengoi]|nr:hypothetical protein C8J57DRAFT_1233000 [Mycena rebaudengoi]
MGPEPHNAARRADADVVTFYSSKHHGFTAQGPAALLEIENIVEKQLKQTRRRTSVDVASIVLIHDKDLDKSRSFPFTHESHFLSLEGEDLFRTLVVVQAAAENILKIGPKALPANGNTKLDEQARLLQLYQDWARQTGRHYNQAIILLVGHSGHGKSKTINRLVGHNLLEVGQVNKLGSTTKVVQRVKISVPALRLSAEA